MNENKLLFDKFHEELADSMIDEESSTYHRKLIELVRELCSITTPEGLKERFLQFVRANGLRKKVDSGLYAFAEEAVDRYYTEYNSTEEDIDEFMESLNSQSSVKDFSKIPVPRGQIVETRTRKKFIIRLLDCISHFEKNQYEENGNIISFVPSSYHKPVVGSRGAGYLLDFDCIETLLIREGIISFYADYEQPIKDGNKVLRKGKCRRFILNNDRLEALRSGVGRYVITDVSFLRRQLNKVCNLNDNELIIALGIFNFTPLKKDYDSAIENIEWYKSGEKDKMIMDYGTARAIKALYEKDYEMIISWSMDDYSGRFHSIVTRFSGTYRKRMVTIEGENTVEVDLRSAQPSILFVTIERELGYRSPIATSCMNGLFYEELAVRGGLADTIEEVLNDESIRKKAKLLFMEGCYSSSLRNTGSVGKFNRTIKSWDENAYQYIQSKRKALEWGGIRKCLLPKTMQEEEVQLILVNVVGSCIKKGITAITTIHDCVKCRESDAPRVKEIVVEEFFKRYDRIPIVNLEHGT